MKKSRFTEAQIVAILKELDGGTPATELGRENGSTEAEIVNSVTEVQNGQTGQKTPEKEFKT